MIILKWQIKPAENRFSSSLVDFVAPKEKGLIVVDIRVIKNVPADIETMFDLVVPGLRSTIPNFELNEGPNCNKYTTADGSQACYIIYTRTSDYISPIKLAIQAIGVKVGSDVYLIGYTTFPNTFDKDLPIAEQMIASFKGSG